MSTEQEQQHQPQPSTPKRLLKMLSSTLTPSSITPRSRKRAASSTPVGNVIDIPGSPVRNKKQKQIGVSSSSTIEKQSQIKQSSDKKIPTIKMESSNSNISSPPTTPHKLQNISSQSNPFSDVTPKKLDFQKLVTGSSCGQVTPPITPIKSDLDIKLLDSSKLTSKKLDLSIKKEEQQQQQFQQRQYEKLQDNKENLVEKELTRQKSIYARAKAIFQRGFNLSISQSLPEREQESTALQSFIQKNLSSEQSSSLYISGPPGTGKTAQVNLTLSQFINTSKKGVQTTTIDGKTMKIGYTFINCMIISQVKTIFNEILKNITGSSTSLNSSKSELLKIFTSDDTIMDMNIVVLDELDKLVTSDQQILFELFSWTAFPNSNLLLIGISNSLDMIDRLLPRLKINGLNPNTLSFLPYSAEQIKTIIITKLKLLNKDPNSENIPIMHPAAIQLCAKKSSNNTGDLRKAFDICRNSIEMVEKEIRGLNSNGVINLENRGNYNEETAPKVKINHIAKICAGVFDNNQSTRLKNLNLQQKFIICMLISFEKEIINEVITLNSLYEYYMKKIQVDRLIGVLKKGEFLEIISALESIGIVKVARSIKEYSQVRITSSISEKDLKLIVQGIAVLEKLMNI